MTYYIHSCCTKASAKARSCRDREEAHLRLQSRGDGQQGGPRTGSPMFKKHGFKEHIFENDSLVYCVRKSPLNWNLPRELTWPRRIRKGTPRERAPGGSVGAPPPPALSPVHSHS